MTEEPKFGTSGLRGLETALTDELCAAYSQAFAEIAGRKHLLIGEDLRASSPRIAQAVANGVARAGVTPIMCGQLPTPALAYAAGMRDFAAIMVTGSHIPADRNGLKFYRGADEITKEDEAPLIARAQDISPDDTDAMITADRLEDALDQFVERFVTFFGDGLLDGLRVGVWQHSSVARDFLQDVLTQLGADVVGLDRRDDFVAVDTEAVSGDLRDTLAGWTREHRLDAIVSTDGDADRPLLTDETGRVVPGDILGPLTARFLEADHVATPVSSNTMIEHFDMREVRRTKIGSPYVIAAMSEMAGDSDARVVGYEPNGGFLLGFEAQVGGRRMAPLLTRDFALPIIATLAAARERMVPVSQLVTDLPRRCTATDRLQDVPTEFSRSLVASIIDGDTSILPPELGPSKQVDTTDGARMTFAGGEIVTIRPSGNAPELRAYVEAADDARAWGLLQDVLERLRRAVSQD